MDGDHHNSSLISGTVIRHGQSGIEEESSIITVAKFEPKELCVLWSLTAIDMPTSQAQVSAMGMPPP
ncbi:hypothetical protein MUK42_27533 [Musa troglodytarum]|uniref:Uncharacterized protein n=1 Tax=Musa troglodytarum TaxID=320322 RepID=A0A9E7KC91_9LILI|nr:hypothetical protein MUK42_27533 [Musa troglodytarum]